MKPLKEDQQPRSTSVVLCCALGVKPKILSTKKKGLDASNDRGLTERSGEVFSLDILSHRMSEIEIYRQVTGRGPPDISVPEDTCAVRV